MHSHSIWSVAYQYKLSKCISVYFLSLKEKYPRRLPNAMIPITICKIRWKKTNIILYNSKMPGCRVHLELAGRFSNGVGNFINKIHFSIVHELQLIWSQIQCTSGFTQIQINETGLITFISFRMKIIKSVATTKLYSNLIWFLLFFAKFINNFQIKNFYKLLN